jgi:hypothetical protein
MDFTMSTLGYDSLDLKPAPNELASKVDVFSYQYKDRTVFVEHLVDSEGNVAFSLTCNGIFLDNILIEETVDGSIILTYEPVGKRGEYFDSFYMTYNSCEDFLTFMFPEESLLANGNPSPYDADLMMNIIERYGLHNSHVREFIQSKSIYEYSLIGAVLNRIYVGLEGYLE